MSPTRQVVVVGAGIAGAAGAWWLARAGLRVTVLEREDAPDRHSSGRNAAILRTAMPDPVLHRLARESLAFYRQPPAGFAAGPLFEPRGLYLAAPGEAGEALLAWGLREDCAGGCRRVPAEELYRRLPELAPGIEVVLAAPDEGVFDLSAIHQGFLRGARAAGAEIRFGAGVEDLVLAGGRAAGVRCAGETVAADAVLIASGGWAGRGLGGFDLPLEPRRRHLLVTEPQAGVADWPVVWLAGREFYFRPESGGLLMSACDECVVDPDHGEEVDPSRLEELAERAAFWLPRRAEAGAAFFWSGMRTFAPDHRFVIGPDPRCPGLFWNAGLGGHGITCGPAAGRLAADWILGRPVDGDPVAAALAPGRLLGRTAASR
ncbi:MAG: FAD-binding oxidoreductase [Planctomycetota bacterium]|nr:MAG: FAD-binding oxidoreductase [Planctomycetota bacterium]